MSDKTKTPLEIIQDLEQQLFVEKAKNLEIHNFIRKNLITAKVEMPLEDFDRIKKQEYRLGFNAGESALIQNLVKILEGQFKANQFDIKGLSEHDTFSVKKIFKALEEYGSSSTNKVPRE